MKILVIGDAHVTGFGLSAGQVGFVGHFVRQISRAGQPVTVELHSPPTLADCHAQLVRLPLERYDLIIWQCGADALSQPPTPTEPTTGWQRICQQIRAVVSGKSMRDDAATYRQAMLTLLRPQRHKVLIMLPIEQPQDLTWWGRQQRRAFLGEGYQQGFSMFDTSLHVRPTDEYFLDRHPAYLNAISHELIGRALFDFYQATPTIVAIRWVRKNE
ncbi:SGNH/GDSL hydrolase family protein [Spirosoma rhododendri]|uniref:SGNH/GDSL hydrolase family protein n=1 Tax=Spirosoma rhododendri TaxID=2728024 RepID=A0A7L5DU16_9BACT|nr:hypothetical protein [Spirosoma rhododendri]QJD80088.1 hypothetical protein HH216_17975 [Spirosoma rhododendri]